jgi:hypothetical protein
VPTVHCVCRNTARYGNYECLPLSAVNHADSVVRWLSLRRFTTNIPSNDGFADQVSAWEDLQDTISTLQSKYPVLGEVVFSSDDIGTPLLTLAAARSPPRPVATGSVGCCTPPPPPLSNRIRRLLHGPLGSAPNLVLLEDGIGSHECRMPAAPRQDACDPEPAPFLTSDPCTLLLPTPIVTASPRTEGKWSQVGDLYLSGAVRGGSGTVPRFEQNLALEECYWIPRLQA